LNFNENQYYKIGTVYMGGGWVVGGRRVKEGD
jgi:hypothetical protein